MAQSLDTDQLETEVKTVYRNVAQSPDQEYHFEMGRGLAERLGYRPEHLDQVPAAAIDSFAGVGYHFDIAQINEGESVLDLGSGSGTDVFVAALHVGETGDVVGLDMTEEQLEKSRALRDEAGFDQVSFEQGYIEEPPFPDDRFDVVISNGVINLSAEKERVFAEALRMLKPGGRLALSDIISEQQLPNSIKSDADLWASCIGGAEQIDQYTTLIEDTGFEVADVRENDDYRFISESAASACDKYGIKSISLSAQKPA